MFLGEHHRTIDSKGRIFIPAKFREEIIKGVIITKGFDEKCLFMFSKEGWKRIQDKIVENPMAKRNIQRFSRWFFSSATMESIDQQGRTRIPQNLVDHADLKKEIVLVGVSDRAEIWSRENWDNYYNNADSQFSEDQNAFEELGF
jgi:MraZ protein